INASGNPVLWPTGRATWAVLILPYLEQENLHRQWNLAGMYYDQNAVARTTAGKSYFCPTRRRPGSGTPLSISGDVPRWVPPGAPHYPGALGDYAVVVDRSGSDFATPATPSMTAAFLRADKGFGFLSFTDGLSNTLLVGEKHVPLGKEGVGWWDCSLYNG